MKRLPPSIQEKKRYLKFRIHSEEDVELGEVVNAVWNSALNFLGSKSASKADFWILGNKFDEKEQEGVIRVNQDMEQELRAALALIDRVDSEEAFLEILDVSGTLKSLEDRG